MGIVLVAIIWPSLDFNVLLVGLASKEPSQSKKTQLLKESLAKIETNEGCATMMVLESRAKIALEINSQSVVASNRPTDPGGVIDGKQHLLPQLYNTTKFVLHWTNGSGDGGSSADAVSLTYVENLATILENVWSFEVTIREFPAPPNDTAEPNDLNKRNPNEKFDVFVYDLPVYNGIKYYGYAYPEQYPNPPSYTSYGYIALDNDFLGFSVSQLEAMQTVAAHEFFHAIQFGFDCTEESWWMETTATYMEDEVYPDVNRNYIYLPFWFLYSDTYGLESTEGSHEYGNFIFAKHISEDYGASIIKEIWEEMQKPGINGLKAIDNVLIAKNSSLVNDFSNFVTGNFFLEDEYVDGVDYRAAITGKSKFNGVWIEYQYKASTASNYTEINQSNVEWDAGMDKWASDYITMELDPAKPRYRIFFDGLYLNINYLVKLVTKKNGVISERIFNLDEEKDGYLDLAYDTFDNITLIIANTGNTTSTWLEEEGKFSPSYRVIITIPSGPPPVYDVAVTNLKSSTYYVSAGKTINISITVKNNGTTRNEDFKVSVYWGQFLIETKQITGLPPGTEEILEIAWTIPLSCNGSEKIWANATLVPDDANPANNIFEDYMLRIFVPRSNGPTGGGKPPLLR